MAKNHDLKRKNLMGIPWRVALALQADGWTLRCDIIWNKSNAMPESVRDRPTRSHEYLFLLAKQERYYYDRQAIQEPLVDSSIKRMGQSTFDRQMGGAKDYGASVNANRSARRTLVHLRDRTRSSIPEHTQQRGHADGTSVPYAGSRAQQFHGYSLQGSRIGCNKRSVWTVGIRSYKGAHFATFPPDLIRPCIQAGSPPNAIVLDPFMGSGTTGQVCREEGRRFVGIELKEEYVRLARARIDTVPARNRRATDEKSPQSRESAMRAVK